MTPLPSSDITSHEFERVRAAQPMAPAALPFAATLQPRSRQRVQRTLLIWVLLVISFLIIWYFLVPAAPIHR